jgi:hypothetical protein
VPSTFSVPHLILPCFLQQHKKIDLVLKTPQISSLLIQESISGRVVKTLVSGIFSLLEKREKTLEKD